MEWFGIVLVGAVLGFWWLGRDPPAPSPAAGVAHQTADTGPVHRTGVVGASAAAMLGTETLRRATDMNDPNGTFMDGYVAGRLTERAEIGDAPTGRPDRDVASWLQDDASCEDDGFSDDFSDDW